MTGFDLGPPDAPERGQQLQQRLSQGAFPNYLGRRVFEFESDQYAGGGAVLGVPAAMGKGLADAGLGLLRGAQWLGVDVLGVLPEPEKRIPSSLMELLPEEQAMRLESRLARAPGGAIGRGAGEVAGNILSMIPSGGASAVGLVSKLATAPGKVIQGLGAPGMKVGEKLIQNPTVAAWLGKAAPIVPGILGSSTGFGLYNYATAEGGVNERMGAAMHGMMMGGALHVLGKVADVAEGSILSLGTSEGAAKTLSALAQQIRAGGKPKWQAVKEALQITGGKGAAGLIEGTGFAGLDERFVGDLIDSFGGDEDARERAMATYFGSVAGALLARNGNPNSYLFFRREQPELNNLGLRMDADSVANPQKLLQEPQQPSGGKPTEPQPTGGGAPTSDPLFQSGWEVAPQGLRQDRVDVEFPGQGAATLYRDGRMEVSPEVYRLVRGEDAELGTEGKVTLTGAAAEEFARDLAAVSAMRRMKGELLFGGNEAWAGGPWNGDNGKVYTVGLDGDVYSRPWPFREQEGWKPDANLPVQLNKNQRADEPAMQSWVDLAKSLRKVAAPNPGMEMLDSAIVLAMHGDPRSRSVQELQSFLLTPWNEGQDNAQSIGPLLTPQNIEQVAFIISRLGSGHINAMGARQALSEALLGPGVQQEPPTLAVEGQQEPLPAEQRMQELAGSRDWNTAPKPERRAAAEQFAEQALAEGAEVAPSALRQTFGIPMSTARDILGRRKAAAGDPERGAFTLPTREEIREKVVDPALSLPRKYYEKMTVALSRGGPVSKDISKRALKVVDETKRNLGKLSGMAKQTLKETVPVGILGRANREAVKFAETPIFEGQYGEAPWKRLLEGEVVEGAPEQLQRWAETYRDVRMATGRLAQEAGTLRKQKDDKPVPFEPVPREVPLYIRQMHEEFSNLAKKGGPRFLEAAELISKYRRNAFPATVIAGQLRAAADPVEGKEAFEFFRDIPDMPSHLKLSDGSTIQILETSPHKSIRRMIEGSAARAPFVKHFGQDFGGDITGKPGPTKLLDMLHKEGGDVAQARFLMQSLQNATPDTLRFLPRWLRALETTTRTAIVMPSAVLDLIEPIATTPIFTGYRSSLMGLVQALGNWRAVRKHLEDIGALTVEAGHHMMLGDAGWMGWVTDKLGLPKRLASDFSAVFAGGAALHVLNRIATDEGGPFRARMQETLQRLEFSSSEVVELMSGEARDDLKKTFVRRLVANATGQLLRGERSRAGASNLFNFLVPLNKYWENRFDQTMTAARELREAADPTNSLTFSERRAKTTRAMTMMTSAAIAGAIGLYVTMALMDGPADAAEAIVAEASKDPLAFAARAAASSWLGGAVRDIKNLFTETQLPLAMRMERAVPAASLVIREAIAASTGAGPYKNEDPMEKFGTLLSRTMPIARRLDFVASWAGLIDSDMEGAFWQLSDWQRIAKIPITTRGSDPTPADVTWVRSAGKIARAIRAAAMDSGSAVATDPAVDTAIRSALDIGSGEDIAEALLGKRVLPKLSAEQVADLQATKGDGVMRRLRAHDEALSRVADTYRRVPKNLAASDASLGKEFDELLTVARRAAVAGSAKGFRDALELVDEAWQARRLAGMDPPTAELERLSAMMADHPEVAREMFSERQGRRIEAADPSWRPAVIGRMLLERVRNGKPITVEKAQEPADAK